MDDNLMIGTVPSGLLSIPSLSELLLESEALPHRGTTRLFLGSLLGSFVRFN